MHMLVQLGVNSLLSLPHFKVLSGSFQVLSVLASP
jgi:hypothetical protein